MAGYKKKTNEEHVEENKNLIYEGATISQLQLLFDLDRRTITQRLGTLDPSGKRRGFPIYNIAKAAAYLAPPQEDQVIKVLEKMPASKLPIHLQKEFWDALRSRQLYEENAKDLWRTDVIVDFVIDILKTVRESVNVFEDTVDRETELSIKQRAIIQTLVDDLLNDVSKKLQTQEIYQHYVSVHGEQGEEVDPAKIYDLTKMFNEAVEDPELGL